jgi:hypothetical protein
VIHQRPRIGERRVVVADADAVESGADRKAKLWPVVGSRRATELVDGGGVAFTVGSPTPILPSSIVKRSTSLMTSLTGVRVETGHRQLS